MHEAVADLFRAAGVEHIEPLELPGTAPIVTGEIPAPDGAPTVLLYSHYDVVPAGDESAWETPPFEATERAGRTVLLSRAWFRERRVGKKRSSRSE